MEFLVQIKVAFPPDMPAEQLADVMAREVARGEELKRAGTIVAMYLGTRPLGALNQNWENVMKRLFFLAMAGALALIAGCNTVEGAGKDIKAGGRAIERAADDAKPK